MKGGKKGGEEAWGEIIQRKLSSEKLESPNSLAHPLPPPQTHTPERAAILASQDHSRMSESGQEMHERREGTMIPPGFPDDHPQHVKLFPW